MKKIIFTLMTVFALVITVSSVKAQNETAVLAGGTYTYNLSGVVSANDATATVTYDGGGETITQIGTTWDITGGATSVVSFTIQYGTQALPAGDGNIKVVITDDVSGCTNEILLAITVSMPTYTLTMAKDETGYSACQARTGSGDNLADARGTESNSFKFSVTPVITGVTGNFTYSYSITLPSNAVLTGFDNGASGVPAYSGGVVTYTNVSTVQTDEFEVTFTTTTGESTQTIAASIDVSTSTLVPVDGGGTYTASLASGGSASESVTVSAVPTIGGFN